MEKSPTVGKLWSAVRLKVQHHESSTHHTVLSHITYLLSSFQEYCTWLILNIQGANFKQRTGILSIVLINVSIFQGISSQFRGIQVIIYSTGILV